MALVQNSPSRLRRLMGVLLVALVAYGVDPVASTAHAETCYPDGSGNQFCVDVANTDLVQLSSTPMFAMNDAEYTALRHLEAEAVGAVRDRHGLSDPGDDRILTYARSPLRAELLGLVLAAAQKDAGARTADEVTVLAWYAKVRQRMNVDAAIAAIDEYQRFYGEAEPASSRTTRAPTYRRTPSSPSTRARGSVDRVLRHPTGRRPRAANPVLRGVHCLGHGGEPDRAGQPRWRRRGDRPGPRRHRAGRSQQRDRRRRGRHRPDRGTRGQRGLGVLPPVRRRGRRGHRVGDGRGAGRGDDLRDRRSARTAAASASSSAGTTAATTLGAAGFSVALAAAVITTIIIALTILIVASINIGRTAQLRDDLIANAIKASGTPVDPVADLQTPNGPRPSPRPSSRSP